jgi:hypothetical protein
MTKTQRIELTAGAVVIWTFAVTVFRAVRSPNDFAEAHWLLDYRFGFMKRGLIGSLTSTVTDFLDLQMSPRLITILSAITLCSMFAALLYLLGRAFRRQQARDSLLVVGLVFASSPFVVMSAHLLGYFDALLYCLGLAAVGLVLCDRPFFGALVSSAAILVHESYLLICFPLVCLASVGVLTANSKHAPWRPHIVALSIPLAVFLAVSLLQPLTTDSMALQSQLKEHLDSFGFVPTRSERVALWQTTTFLEFLRQHHGAFDERLLNPVILASIGPTLLFILLFIHLSFRIRALSFFSIMVLGVVCAPLAMHAVASDTARISTYTIGGAFIACWIFAETRGARIGRVNDILLLTAFLALVLNIFGRLPLMDGRDEHLTDIARLLMYSPAITLFLVVVVRNRPLNWFREFRSDRISNRKVNHYDSPGADAG